MFKNITISISTLNRIFGLVNVGIWSSLFLEKVVENPILFQITQIFKSIEILSRKLWPKYQPVFWFEI